MLFVLIFIAQFALTTLIFTINDDLDYQIAHPHLWIFGLHFLMLFCAPIQSGLSDHYCRKKSLIIAMGAIVLSQICLYLSYKYGVSWKLASFVIMGTITHVVPISTAAIMNTGRQALLTDKIGIITVMIFLGWVLSLWAVVLLTPIQRLITIFVLSIIAFIAVLSLYCNLEDKKAHPKQQLSVYTEVLLFGKMFKKYEFRLLLYCLFLVNLGFYVAFRYDEVTPLTFYNQYTITVWVIGYCFGVLGLIILRRFIEEHELLQIGFIISMPLIFILAITRFWLSTYYYLFFIIDFLFAVGVGLIIPLLLVFCSRYWHKNGTFQGKVFGLAESTDTLALIMSSLFLAFPMPLFLFYVISIACFVLGFHALRKLRPFKQPWI